VWAMERKSRRAALQIKPLERRSLPRTSVLWSGIIAKTDGASSVDCLIRNISDGGAEISSKRQFVLGEQVYLLVPRIRIAYMASVAWLRSGRAGFSFDRSYELDFELPPEANFLKNLLVETKLRHALSLVQQGLSVQEAATTVDWTEAEIDGLEALPR
jgi:hypothetical protein